MDRDPHFDVDDFDFLDHELKLTRLKVTMDTLNDQVARMKSKFEAFTDLEHRIGAIERSLTDVIERLNDSRTEGRETLSQQRFETFVREALTLGMSHLGVSKLFIRRVLQDSHGLEDTRYLRRRLNALLKQKVEEKEFVVTGELYKLAN